MTIHRTDFSRYVTGNIQKRTYPPLKGGGGTLRLELGMRPQSVRAKRYVTTPRTLRFSRAQSEVGR